ncbi:TolC family protein [Sphingobium chlorophenolicum]|uniref:Outer membrane protein n=1 Tax=Sphingobium chlorophenolicum TaxID=46429 RepID=A0A081RDX9_SPHCR|nr:TolC family protein [Sphingobium chlorophenolicum]KEQ53402.1 Outer membrane protein precursor [Sphingobium chlorophenolicum]
MPHKEDAGPSSPRKQRRRGRKIRLGWASILLSAAFPAIAAPTTVEQAVRKGLAINPELRAGKAEESAAGTDVSIAGSGYYPSVSVSGGPQSFRLDGIAYDVVASQMLYDWGRTKSAVADGRAVRRQLSEKLRQKREEVALSIVEVYLDILVTQRQVAGLQTHIADLEDIWRMTAARSEGRYSDRSEPDRAGLELARAREQLAIEQGTLDNAHHEYLLLVGEEADGLSDPSPASVAAYIARNDLQKLIEESPAYRAMTEGTRSAEAKLRQARAEMLPQLNLEGSMTRRDIGGTPVDDATVALRLRSNFQGISSFLRPKGAQQRIQAAIWNEATTSRELRRELRTLLDHATMLRGRQEMLEAQVSASTDLGVTYLEQFRAGRRDLIDLLNARRERFEAQRQLISARIDRLRDEYRAAAKLGLVGDLLEKGLY